MNDSTDHTQAIVDALEGLLAYCETVDQRLLEAEEQINTLIQSGGGFSSASADVDLGVEGTDLDRVREALAQLQE